MFNPPDLFVQMPGEALQLFFRLHQGVVHPRLPQRAQRLQIAFLVDAQTPLEVVVPVAQRRLGFLEQSEAATGQADQLRIGFAARSRRLSSLYGR